MTLDSIRARTGQRKNKNPIAEKINNRVGDGSHDPKFERGMRGSGTGGRNSVVDKIKSHGDI